MMTTASQKKQCVTVLVSPLQHAALLTAHDAGDGAPAARRAADREEDRAAAVAEPAAAEETAVRFPSH